MEFLFGRRENIRHNEKFAGKKKKKEFVIVVDVQPGLVISAKTVSRQESHTLTRVL